MHIVIAPGAFKNSLSAGAAAAAIEKGLKRSGLEAQLHVLPIADGGNGTLDAFLMNGGQRKTLTVEGPQGEPVNAAYGLLKDGQTAVIEMAQASGLELVANRPLNPMTASTYGTGQLMQAALEAGATRIIVGMGGSATVDGGLGALQALGVGLFNAYGAEVARGGGNLSQVFIIDTQGLDPRWRDVEVLIATDVDNPTLGPDGAAAIFGPQKGATPGQVDTLETGLRHFFTLVKDQLGKDVRQLEGGGAAGALSAGLAAFLDAHIESGIALVMAHGGFSSLLDSADLVITGEGRMDSQTVHGKGPIGVARLAQQHGVPTVALVGGLALDDQALHEAGIQAALPLVTEPMSLDDALAQAGDLLERAALRLGYLLQVRKTGLPASASTYLVE
ncbi:MAG: glycerate kinase [Anaerolineae bacterium]|nr:glycerate kinase [Anaerolineae bacterium]